MTKFSKIVQGKCLGDGSGGRPFMSIDRSQARALIGVEVAAGKYVDSIRPIYRLITSGKLGKVVREARIGGAGGTRRTLTAPDGWVVAGIDVRAGSLIDAIRLVFKPYKSTRVYKKAGWFKVPTNRFRVGSKIWNQKSTKWYGGKGGTDRTIAFAKGAGSILGLHGFASRYLDNLGIVYSTSGAVKTGNIAVRAAKITGGKNVLRSALSSDRTQHVKELYKVEIMYDDYGNFTDSRKTFKRKYSPGYGWYISYFRQDPITWRVNHLLRYDAPERASAMEVNMAFRLKCGTKYDRFRGWVYATYEVTLHNLVFDKYEH